MRGGMDVGGEETKGTLWVFGLSNLERAAPVAEMVPLQEEPIVAERRGFRLLGAETPRPAIGEDMRTAGHTSLELRGAGRAENTTGSHQQQEVASHALPVLTLGVFS